MVGVGGSSPLATTKFKRMPLNAAFFVFEISGRRTTEGGLTKSSGIKLLLHLTHSCHPWQLANFEQTSVWSEGRGQESPSSPLATGNVGRKRPFRSSSDINNINRQMLQVTTVWVLDGVALALLQPIRGIVPSTMSFQVCSGT